MRKKKVQEIEPQFKIQDETQLHIESEVINNHLSQNKDGRHFSIHIQGGWARRGMDTQKDKKSKILVKKAIAYHHKTKSEVMR